MHALFPVSKVVVVVVNGCCEWSRNHHYKLPVFLPDNKFNFIHSKFFSPDINFICTSFIRWINDFKATIMGFVVAIVVVNVLQIVLGFSLLLILIIPNYKCFCTIKSKILFLFQLQALIPSEKLTGENWNFKTNTF